MHVIVLAAQKGGCGKSTLAVGLAIAAMDAGQRVGMIDADPQGTISNWGRRRTNPEPCIEPADSGMAIERAILHLRSDGCTVAIIDTAATNNSLSTSGIGAADLCRRARVRQISRPLCRHSVPSAGSISGLLSYSIKRPGAAIASARPGLRSAAPACSRFLASPSATTIKTLSEWAWASPSTIPTGKPQKRYTISGGGPGNH